MPSGASAFGPVTPQATCFRHVRPLRGRLPSLHHTPPRTGAIVPGSPEVKAPVTTSAPLATRLQIGQAVTVEGPYGRFVVFSRDAHARQV